MKVRDPPLEVSFTWKIVLFEVYVRDPIWNYSKNRNLVECRPRYRRRISQRGALKHRSTPKSGLAHSLLGVLRRSRRGGKGELLQDGFQCGGCSTFALFIGLSTS